MLVGNEYGTREGCWCHGWEAMKALMVSVVEVVVVSRVCADARIVGCSSRSRIMTRHAHPMLMLIVTRCL